MHDIVPIVKSNDVKPYTEKEAAHLHEVELNNRTVEKMICYKYLFHMIHEICKAVAFMTSTLTRKKSRISSQRRLCHINWRTR